MYLRWERDGGSACCRLVTGKTQVAPKVKITIPRIELVAAVNPVRLARKVKGGAEDPPSRELILHGLISNLKDAEGGIRKIY